MKKSGDRNYKPLHLLSLSPKDRLYIGRHQFSTTTNMLPGFPQFPSIVLGGGGGGPEATI